MGNIQDKGKATIRRMKSKYHTSYPDSENVLPINPLPMFPVPYIIAFFMLTSHLVAILYMLELSFPKHMRTDHYCKDKYWDKEELGAIYYENGFFMGRSSIPIILRNMTNSRCISNRPMSLNRASSAAFSKLAKRTAMNYGLISSQYC